MTRFFAASAAASGMLAAIGSVASRGAAIPLAATGYNADVIIDANINDLAGTGFDGSGNTLIETGATSNDQVPHTTTTDGLPSSGTIVSTGGSGATYQLQGYNGNNALQFNTSGKLTLSSPIRLSELDILAASANAKADSTGTLTLTFSDSTTDTLSYNAADWFTGGTNSEPIAINGLSRGSPNNPASWSWDAGNSSKFGLYETSLVLSTIDQSKTISSITFGLASNAAQTNVFAVSGIVATPEPASMCMLGLGGLSLLSRRRRA